MRSKNDCPECGTPMLSCERSCPLCGSIVMEPDYEGGEYCASENELDFSNDCFFDDTY